MSVLTVRKLTMRFGGITAVSDLDLAVEPGQIFSVIGPNGAGKTTLFNAVTGVYEPTEGDVLFAGRSVARPFTPRVALRSAALGLAAGLVALIFAVRADGLWKTAVVLQQIYYRWAKGKTTDARFGALIMGVRILAEQARAAINRGSI